MPKTPSRKPPKQSKAKYRKLRQLKCFDEFYHRVLIGWPVVQLVRFIQVDNNELMETSEKSLSTLVREFRSDIPPGEFISMTPPKDMVEQRMTPLHEKAIQKLNTGLNELEELEDLLSIQKQRIHLGRDVEITQGTPLGHLTQDIRAAVEIINASSKLKMDLGITQRHLGVQEIKQTTKSEVIQHNTNQNLHHHYDHTAERTEEVQKVLDNPQSRLRLGVVADALERFMLTSGSEREKQDANELIAELIRDEVLEDDSKEAEE